MCVILVCKKKLPSLEDLQKCEAENDDGGGLSYHVGDKVRYVKGLSAKDIFAIISGKTDTEAKLPFVIHFRSASAGFDKVPELCHPFVVNKNVSIKTSGDVGKVLFHNGTWTQWKDVCLQICLKTSSRFPMGTWSDSRGAAFAIKHKGEGMLNLITGKFAIMSKTGIRLYGDGWVHEDGISYSNTYWRHKSVTDSSYYPGSASHQQQVFERGGGHTCQMGCD